MSSTAEVSAQTANHAKEIIDTVRRAHVRIMKFDTHERDSRGKGIRLRLPDIQKDIPRGGKVLVYLDHIVLHVREHHS
jgi:hypothetical protein